MKDGRGEGTERRRGDGGGQRQHPEATFTEIERALDGRLSEVRARLLEELVKEREVGSRGSVERCRKCGSKLRDAGKRKRRLTTTGEQSVTLERRYLTCPVCKTGLFPPG